MDERRAKGLCFWCEEKYTPNHKCKKRQAFVMQLIVEGIEDEEGVGKREIEEEVVTDVQLSLSAMWGIQEAQTMRIIGEYGKKKLHILVDTGSTHNFLTARMASN